MYFLRENMETNILQGWHRKRRETGIISRVPTWSSFPRLHASLADGMWPMASCRSCITASWKLRPCSYQGKPGVQCSLYCSRGVLSPLVVASFEELMLAFVVVFVFVLREVLVLCCECVRRWKWMLFYVYAVNARLIF